MAKCEQKKLKNRKIKVFAVPFKDWIKTLK